MAWRTWGIVSSLIGASGVMAADLMAAAPQAQRAKAADHATGEADQTRSGDVGHAGQGSITWPGMTREGAVLLPNGWSLKPAGRQTRLGDLPVQMALRPRAPILAILHAGYGEHEVL